MRYNITGQIRIAVGVPLRRADGRINYHLVYEAATGRLADFEEFSSGGSG